MWPEGPSSSPADQGMGSGTLDLAEPSCIVLHCDAANWLRRDPGPDGIKWGETLLSSLMRLVTAQPAGRRGRRMGSCLGTDSPKLTQHVF